MALPAPGSKQELDLAEKITASLLTTEEELRVRIAPDVDMMTMVSIIAYTLGWLAEDEQIVREGGESEVRGC